MDLQLDGFVIAEASDNIQSAPTPRPSQFVIAVRDVLLVAHDETRNIQLIIDNIGFQDV